MFFLHVLILTYKGFALLLLYFQKCQRSFGVWWTFIDEKKKSNAKRNCMSEQNMTKQ